MIVKPRGKSVDMNRQLTIRGRSLENVESYKYLGLIIDSNFSWKPHVDFVRNKIKPILALLRKTSYFLPNMMKLSIYYSYIHSHLSYLISVWGSTGSTRLNHLQRLQNKSLRFIFADEYRDPQIHTNDLYDKYRILKVTELREYDFCTSIFKIKNGLMKSNLDFPTVSAQHDYGTRRRSQVQIPSSRTNYSRNSILHEGVNDFNEIPSMIRNLTSFSCFKSHLKSFIIGKRSTVNST